MAERKTQLVWSDSVVVSFTCLSCAGGNTVKPKSIQIIGGCHSGHYDGEFCYCESERVVIDDLCSICNTPHRIELC